MKKRKFLLEKTKLNKAVKELSKLDDKIVIEMEDLYERLLKENRSFDNMLMKHLKISILPAIAVYKTLISHGKTKDYAYEYVRKYVLYESEKSKKIFQKIGYLPFGFYLMRFICPISIKMNFGKSGWNFEWKKNDSTSLEWNCHKCFYKDVFLKYDVYELTFIFCESDDIVYGSIPTITWARKRTIGKGDEICDFKFYNERKSNKSK